MSIAARAMSSHAVSSISLAGITAIFPSPYPLPPHPTLSPSGERIKVRGTGRAWVLPFPLPFVSTKLVLDGIHQRLPGGLDDIVGHAHRAPRLIAVTRGDEHAGLGRGPFRLVQDAHLVVQQCHLFEI